MAKARDDDALPRYTTAVGGLTGLRGVGAPTGDSTAYPYRSIHWEQ